MVLSILWYLCDKNISLKQSCPQLFQVLQGITFLQLKQSRAEQRKVGTTNTVSPCMCSHRSGNRAKMADATNSEGEPSDKVHVTADTPAIFKSVFGSISFLFVKK